MDVFRNGLLAAALLATVWLSSCGNDAPALYATVTYKRDGSQFSGKVVRREPNSITITNATGDTHTFLNTEVSNIKFGNPDAPAGTSKGGASNNASGPGTNPSPGASTPSAPAPVTSEGGTLQFPEGSVFPVRTVGFLDSCCGGVNSDSLATVDGDIRKPGGGVVIPDGANVVIEVREMNKADGRIFMTFEIVSADFGGRHYIVSSAKDAAGARVTFTGAKEGSPEARLRGLHVHLDDHTLMEFKAAAPVVFKVSQ